jgi:hypothetical protein
MLLGNSNLWLTLIIHYKKSIIPCPFFKRYCFQLSPRKTPCKFDPRVLAHPVYENWKIREKLKVLFCGGYA